MSSGKIYEIWHRRHDYWLLAGIVTYPCSVRLGGDDSGRFLWSSGDPQTLGRTFPHLPASGDCPKPWQASASLCSVLLSSGCVVPQPLS